jgi:hypothetical protein
MTGRGVRRPDRMARLVLPCLLGVVVALLAGAYLVRTFGGPEVLGVPGGPAGPTIIGSLAVEPASPVAGQTVTVRAMISADRAVTLRVLAVKVTDEAGTFHDFPELHDYALGSTEQEIILRRSFDKPGVYTYYLAYQADGGVVALPPWQTLTVR